MNKILVPIDKESQEPLIDFKMKIKCIGEFYFYRKNICHDCFNNKNNHCEICKGEVEYNEKITIPWATCKEIYKAMVLAAAI